MNYFNKNKKQIIGLFVFFLIVFTIPLALLLVKQRQELRKKAQEIRQEILLLLEPQANTKDNPWHVGHEQTIKIKIRNLTNDKTLKFRVVGLSLNFDPKVFEIQNSSLECTPPFILAGGNASRVENDHLSIVCYRPPQGNQPSSPFSIAPGEQMEVGFFRIKVRANIGGVTNIAFIRSNIPEEETLEDLSKFGQNGSYYIASFQVTETPTPANTSTPHPTPISTNIPTSTPTPTPTSTGWFFRGNVYQKDTTNWISGATVKLYGSNTYPSIGNYGIELSSVSSGTTNLCTAPGKNCNYRLNTSTCYRYFSIVKTENPLGYNSYSATAPSDRQRTTDWILYDFGSSCNLNSRGYYYDNNFFLVSAPTSTPTPTPTPNRNLTPTYNPTPTPRITPTPTPTPTIISSPHQCPNGENGNLNCDPQGLIDGVDLAILLSKWHTRNDAPMPTPNPGHRNADIAGNDNLIDGLDLAKMLANWKTY
jgi:hypothetical protein